MQQAENTKNHFIFDINKCVGCHACAIACNIENGTELPLLWREINTYNVDKIPNIPVFFHSLACNHCNDAPCKTNCPSLAYIKDNQTNAILHVSENCIGCKYCTWACPFDAPKFNYKTSIVEKCNFCNDRITNGLKPACANLCPTGALDFKNGVLNKEDAFASGFPNHKIEPNIKFIELRDEKKPKILNPQTGTDVLEKYLKEQKVIKSKITLKGEWILVVFTLLAAFLVGSFIASVFSDFWINKYLFLALGIIGILLSSVHLGKKTRAWRSILNLKKSWLSREIFFYSGFLFFASASLFFFQELLFVNSIAIICGILALVSIDMVYHFAHYPTRLKIHSSQIFLTGLLFMCFFAEFYTSFIGILSIKIILYLIRKLILSVKNKESNFIFSFLRIAFSVVVPIILLVLKLPYLLVFLSISFIVGEIIDRCEYYMELDVITPKKQMREELNNTF